MADARDVAATPGVLEAVMPGSIRPFGGDPTAGRARHDRSCAARARRAAWVALAPEFRRGYGKLISKHVVQTRGVPSTC
jgi:hypothetical protein